MEHCSVHLCIVVCVLMSLVPVHISADEPAFTLGVAGFYSLAYSSDGSLLADGAPGLAVVIEGLTQQSE